MSYTTPSSSQQSMHSSIPRFASTTNTETIQLGLTNALTSASCAFAPSAALVGISHAQAVAVKDNNRNVNGSGKQLKLAMNCIYDSDNSDHNGGTDQCSGGTQKGSLLAVGRLSSAIGGNQRNTDPSRLTTKTSIKSDHKIVSHSVHEANPSIESSPLFRASLLPLSCTSSAIQSSPSPLTPLSQLPNCQSTVSAAIVGKPSRAKSLPNSQLNLNVSAPLPDPQSVVDTSSLNNSNLPTFAFVDAAKRQNHIITKLHGVTDGPQMADKMAQPSNGSTTSHQMRLIKSQSLKFENHIKGNSLNSAYFSPSPKVKAEASKSLDTVNQLDHCSKLKRLLATSNNEIDPKMGSENVNIDCALENYATPADGTQCSLSRSSTASLGVLSNLNEILTANDINDVCSEDYDDDANDIHARLAAIDESISPLSSFDYIACPNKETIQFSDTSNVPLQTIETGPGANLPQADMIFDKSSVILSNSITNECAAHDVEIISLESIEMNDPISLHLVATESSVENKENVHLNESEISTKSDDRSLSKVMTDHAKRRLPLSGAPARSSNLSKLTASKTSGRINSSSIATSTSRRNSPFEFSKSSKTTSNDKRFDFNSSRKASSNKSSLPSSSNASRISTPLLSESDFGDTDSFASNSANLPANLSKVISSKLSLQQDLTNNRLKQQQRRVPSNIAVNRTNKSKVAKGNLLKQDLASVSAITTIKRSSTYTRSLNIAQNGPIAKTTPTNDSLKTSSTIKQKMELKTESKTNEPRKAFAKPTASYLKKTTAKSVPVQQTQLQPKRPSSVASNHSAKSQQFSQTTARNKATSTVSSISAAPRPTSTAKLSPTVTLRSGVAKSGQSSRRSSITSPSKIGPPLSRNDEPISKSASKNNFQTLCAQQTNQIRSLQTALKHSWLRSNAFLILNSHLINEYAPFDTPRLRVELASLHEKCCNLHRDYELSKESTFQKDNTIQLLNCKLNDASNEISFRQNEAISLQEKINSLEQELFSFNQKCVELETNLIETQKELCSEKETRLVAETRLEQLELSCRSDKKYRDLKEKVSTFQKEVDSLNVVVDMKTQRTRHLENEIMRIELELSNYENLKEAYQRLTRENEALTETLGMKARKNAEQSREIEQLRNDLKREVNERKRASIRHDQLEYQLNETRELLTEMSSYSSHLISGDVERQSAECDLKDDAPSQARFNSFFDSVSQSKSQSSVSSRISGRNYVRRLFSTPSAGDDPTHFLSRQHYQHQNPTSDSKHRLPELVLSSINANWSHNQPNRSTHTSAAIPASSSPFNAHNSMQTPHHDLPESSSSKRSALSANASPASSRKMPSKKADQFKEFPETHPPVSSPSV